MKVGGIVWVHEETIEMECYPHRPEDPSRAEPYIPLRKE